MAGQCCLTLPASGRLTAPLKSNVRRQREALVTTHTALFIALLLISLGLGTAYTMLGLEAKAHMTPEASESDRSIGWLFWWS